MSLLELFCRVDDFWLAFAPAWKQTLLHSGQIKRQRSGQLAESEIMTIEISKRSTLGTSCPTCGQTFLGW